MFQVLADAHIPFLEHYFPQKYFKLHLYQNLHELKSQISHKDILICRSIYQINAELLENSAVKLVATATSGINHIDTDYLHSKNIELINAKGGNAPAVVDYICATLAALEKHLKFKAHQVAIIGYGCVGKELSRRLEILGYQIAVYDPLIQQESIFRHQQIKHFNLAKFDTICVHANYHTSSPFPSKNLIDAHLKDQFSKHSCIINAARGHIVNEEFILSDAYQGIYCADVFENEPYLNAAIIKRASLATPHIAGHSIESKLRMTEIISYQIHQHFKLPKPTTCLKKTFLPQISLSNWQNSVLSHYDPLMETLALKQQGPGAFFKLRHAHHRHEFFW